MTKGITEGEVEQEIEANFHRFQPPEFYRRKEWGSRLPKKYIVPKSIDDVVEILKTRRQDLGLTYDEAGDRAGLHGSTIWRIDNYARDPEVRTLEQYAGALGFDVYFLLDGQQPSSELCGLARLPQTVRELRGRLGLSQQRAAEASEVSAGAIQRIEEGQSPQLQTLFKFAEAYHLKPILFRTRRRP